MTKFGQKLTKHHQMLKAIPSSVRTELYRGKTYFPNLPPHLSERFFFDATRGEKGALVLLGEFIDAPTGEDYFHLNVLSASDIDQLKGLIVDSDSDKAAWKSAIDNLNTTLELFVEDPTRPGTYAPSSGASVTVPPNGLAEITNDDIAVDSYALTATGPGVGYVTLVSGNGLAFQPEGEPVSLHILRVSETLHRGELKVVESPNPLSEKIGFQQVVDLAAKTDLYDYQWRISPPWRGGEGSTDTVVWRLHIAPKQIVRLRFGRVTDCNLKYGYVESSNDYRVLLDPWT